MGFSEPQELTQVEMKSPNVECYRRRIIIIEAQARSGCQGSVGQDIGAFFLQDSESRG